MTNLPVPIFNRNSTRTAAINGSTTPRPVLVYREDFPDIICSDYAWQIDPLETALRYDSAELPATWNPALGKNVCIYAAGSMPVQQQSNTHRRFSYNVPTSNPSYSNELSLPKPADADVVLQAIIDQVLVNKIAPPGFWYYRDRYFSPQTSVADRIDELILEEHGDENLLLDRRQQAEWLKEVMRSYWGIHLPQPFIGYDLEDGLFVASWQSDSECNTLTIDAEEHKGWYDPWPANESYNPLLREIDLDTEEAWEHLRFALMTTRS